MGTPNPAPGLRAVLYLRQSTYKEESISLEVQEAAGRDYCKQRGYTIVAVEADPGISGRTWNRPAVKQVMEMIDRQEADVVVLWKWSRLSRSRLDWAVAVDRVETAGGRIESATEPMDTSTSAGRLARGMLAEFAAFESERIGDTWKEAQQRRRLRGLPPNGGDRFGYVRSGDTYTPDPATGELLAELYSRYVSGEGFTRIVRTLNENGIHTSTGALWAHDKLRSILDSGFAAGLIVQGRGIHARFYPGAHPALIDEPTWNAYLDRRRQAPISPRVIEPTHFLTGLIFCDECGGPMRAINRNGGPGYGCSNYLRFRIGRFVTCVRPKVEKFVLDAIREFANDIDAQTAIEERTAVSAVTAINDADAIQKRIDALEAQAKAITLRWASGKMLLSTYEQSLAEVEGRITELKGRQRDHSREQQRGPAARLIATGLLNEWESLDQLERRGIVGAFIRGVRVVPPAVRKIGGSAPVTFEIDWAFQR